MADASPASAKEVSHDTSDAIPKQVEEALTSRRELPQERRACWSSASAPARRRSTGAQSAAARSGGSVSRSRFPAARFVDRHSPGQHRHVLRRQDRLRPGHRHGVPPDDVRRARHRLRQDHVHHGQHRHHRRSGRLGRLGRDADRRLADAARRRRSAPRAARNGVRRGSACRSISSPSATP